MIRADLQGASLFEADLRGAHMSKADLQGASLFEADLRGAILLEADLGRADLNEADLWGVFLQGANLQRATLGRANLQGAYLTSVRGAEKVYYLETVRLTSVEDSQGSDAGNDALDFEACHRPWPERWLDWERLRVMGRLPLFGISYTALILIPIIFYGLAVYNQQIERVHTWAEQIDAPPHSPLHQFASLLKHLDRRPIPSLSLVLVVSTVLLAIASTLYTWRCPSRIKEFSRDQWCDQLSRSLLHYWPLAWKHRYVRLTCAACYALWGTGALWVLGTKVWKTACFILQYSTFPWPWR
jgi:hypothetical protein